MKTIKTKGQAQLFQNPILEKLTKSSLTESTFSSIGIAAFSVWIGYYFKGVSGWLPGFMVFIAGLATWSLFEYILHRYLFHIEETAFRGAKRIQYLLHGVHHEYPKDAQRTLLPFLPKVIFSLVFFTFYALLMGWAGAVFYGGFLIGYYVYSMIHYAIHRFRAPKFLKPLWDHHHLHHHLHDEVAYGVSSMLWDWVFNTMPPKYERAEKEVKVERE